MLTRRQERLYTDRCDLFRVTHPIDAATGAPGAEVIARAATDVPCKLVYTANVDDVTVAGRVKRFMLDTADFLHLAADVEVENGWWVANVSRRADGTRHAQFGQVSKVMGGPMIIPGTERRPANVQVLQVEQHEHPPAVVAESLRERAAALFGAEPGSAGEG